MSFTVPADAYDRYMGRYSLRLAPLFARFAGVQSQQRVLDVGCGPGALTAQLASTVGAQLVAAADPSPGFVRACADRVTGADVRIAPGEELPWPDAAFDAVLSQLVLSFVKDADAALREMRRVARPGGTVASCTWDYGGQMQMLNTFWDAALALDPAAPDEARALAYTDPDSLRELWQRTGMSDIEAAGLMVEVQYADFDDYWQPFLTGTGPGGQYCVSLDDGHREALREECFRALGTPKRPFTLTARSWAVRGNV
jgi:ubiquinone/menaquinone biosynthesis C-methylase UbiE